MLDDLRARRGHRQPVDVADDGEDFEGFGPQHAFDFGFDSPPPGAHPADGEAQADARVYPRPVAVSTPQPPPAASPATPTTATPTGTPPEPLPTQPQAEQPPAADERPRARRGRAKVPSWDEIVFGAKPE